jgi:hypothetical protein
MARLITRLGLEGAVAHMAEEFQRLDRARADALALVQTVMVEQGFCLDETWKRDWWFGRNHREAAFHSRRGLTLELRKKRPEEVIFDWLTKVFPLQAPPNLESLSEILRGPKRAPRRKPLPATEIILSDRLPSFESLDLEALDRLASEIVEEAKQEALANLNRGRLFDQHHPLWLWTQPLWYHRPEDTWANEGWWLDLAAKVWAQGPDQLAALILMVNRREEPKAQMLRQLREHDCWFSEAFDDYLLWFLLDDLPWPIDQFEEYPRFAPVLGTLPSPLARRIAAQCREALAAARGASDETERRAKTSLALEYAASLDPVVATDWFEPEETRQLKGMCLEWASQQNDLVALRQAEPLTVAARFSWSEIIDILAGNPAFSAAWLDCDALACDPGTLALRLTQVKPGPLAARFGAHAIVSDFATRVEKQIDALGGKSGSKMRDRLRQGFLNHRRLDRFAAAIAWQRVRAYVPPEEV